MLTDDQRAAVVAEARTWLGTPYHHHARVKGAGVDCAHLLCAVYENAGVTSPIDPGFYATDWHLHRNEEQYLDWMNRYCDQVDEPLPGDIVLFRFGRTFSHSGIVVEGDLVVHAYYGRGAVMNRMTEEPLVGRARVFWRVR